MHEYYQRMMDYISTQEAGNNSLGYIALLINTIVFLVPLLVVIYKQGRKDQVLDEVIKDVNGIGRKVAEIRSEQSQTLSELKSQITNMNTTLAEVTTSMRFIKEAIEELKRH